MVAW
jgi:hypothetical protein